MMPMLPETFFQVPALNLARNLIGCTLVHKSPDGETAGIIVETEAYRQDDEASHSFRGKTPRNAAMFGAGGVAYVYFTYGMHYCFNIVAGSDTFAEGVLIRALQPARGEELMAARRQVADAHNLCSGPAKLVQAMGILPSHNGASVCGPEIWVEPRTSEPRIAAGPRIGITRAMDKPWRFFIPENSFVTKHKFNKIGQ